MSQLCQERGGAFKMPPEPPYGTYRDEVIRSPFATKKVPGVFGNRCEKCGSFLDLRICPNGHHFSFS
ncbi:hypothetical protein HGA34_03500 [Candidatus Falkowbacteria bacterium]|nr:hypothetical protein [Candidatus Falkowbacteria bacterium]